MLWGEKGKGGRGMEMEGRGWERRGVEGRRRGKGREGEEEGKTLSICSPRKNFLATPLIAIESNINRNFDHFRRSRMRRGVVVS